MTRSWWGWGQAENAVPDDQCVQLASLLPGLPERPVPIPGAYLPPVRVTPPDALAPICTSLPGERASHTYGKAYRDVVRALRGDLQNAPDIVAYPRSEADVVDVLDWAGYANVAVIPYGGGTSVVGGVEHRGENPSLSLDLSNLDNVLDIDPISRSARIQAGVLGPDLEDQLRPHGYTLRHFPQSFEFSTLGGWLATRSSGHYATMHTHIDDFVESMRVVTPIGINESWRLPGSGAGPSPDRMFLGSEGTLGVITEAWMRVQERPRHRASTAIMFHSFRDGVRATRAIVQSGLTPANLRLLDAGEARFSGAAQNGETVLVLGFESAHIPVEVELADAVEIARSHGGREQDRDRGDSVERWRTTFLRMPYLRDALARMSVIIETFETATTWDRVDDLVATLHEELTKAVREVCDSPGIVNCRFTHVYPDGAAPYFTVIAPGRRGSEVEMWDEIKAASAEVLHRHRATITHHHAVGRDHMPWYDEQRPEPFAAALVATKRALDPYGILNPGVLLWD
jgi:alkyldihydroxyacetonephosphate synthase